MKFTTIKRKKPNVHLTSLIDIVFLLLIFFLLSSNFIVQQGVNISVPQVENESLDLLPEIAVTIDDKGIFYFQGIMVNEEILQTLLKKQLDGSPKKVVAIRADQRVQYNSIVNVIDIAKSAGAEEFLLITRRE